MPIEFDLNTFETLKDKKWMLGNNILYQMCSDFPNHTNPEEIRAKIWLIGRSYAASIERRTKKKQINDDFYDYVVNKFVIFNKDSRFDERLNQLRSKEFNKETLKDILRLHHELTKFFYKLTGKEKRSLASKYLHFHAQIFPIYDSRAKDSLNEIVKIKTPKLIGDKYYSKFCYKILALYNLIKEKSGRDPTLREIDTYLLKVANSRLNKKQGWEK